MLGIGRYARDERVVSEPFAADRVDHSRHPDRHIPARVDHRIPASAVQRGDIAIAIASQRLDVWMDAGVMPAAGEGGDLMAARQRGFDEPAAEEQSCRR